MFTGLVLGLGRVLAVEGGGRERRFKIAAQFDLPSLVLGESIAVNGACLTVERGEAGVFEVYASAESLSKTSLGGLRVGSLVNLERALALGERLGGHLVSGHVDCLARVLEVSPAGESKIYKMGFPAEFGPLVVEKGSVALDGISLTVNACGADWLSVNIIPSTQGATTIKDWSAGREVNMETDIIGKYVSRMLGPWQGGGGERKAGLTMEFLREHGF